MKIYLAGGASIVNVKGREEKLSKQFPVWNRLLSYFYKEWITNSNILELIKKQQKL